MWLNRSVVTINIMFQLLDIYRYRFGNPVTFPLLLVFLVSGYKLGVEKIN